MNSDSLDQIDMLKSRIADTSQSDAGRISHEWAYRNMPALTRIIERLEAQKPLNGNRIGVCLHVTKETSVLAKGLQRLGANVHLCAANPLTTQDDIAAYLDSTGINVYAWRGETSGEYFECIRNVLKAKPEILMDDGADMHVTYHSDSKYDFNVVGGTEETTTGVVRIEALSRAGKLRYPVIAVNNAYSKFLFDNRYGTGQSTFDGLLRATSLLIAGKKVVVCGYGWVGKGVARRAQGMGAHVIVTEVDPFKALEARLDGYEVMTMREAAKKGDIFITATGQTSVIRGEHIESMRDGAILANAGHFDVEIDVKHLEAKSTEKTKVRPHTDQYVMRSGRRVFLIGEGRITNLVAAEGHPPEVMMMSFSNQLLSAVYLAENAGRMEKALVVVPEEIDREVARSALEAAGVEIDALSEEQIRYREAWVD